MEKEGIRGEMVVARWLDGLISDQEVAVKFIPACPFG